MENWYYEKQIKSGIKTNSMYEPKTINCKSSNEQLQQYYKDTEDLTPKVKKLVPNAMKIYSVPNKNYKNPLTIILED